MPQPKIADGQLCVGCRISGVSCHRFLEVSDCSAQVQFSAFVLEIQAMQVFEMRIRIHGTAACQIAPLLWSKFDVALTAQSARRRGDMKIRITLLLPVQSI